MDVLLRDDNPRYRLYDLTDAGELVGRRLDDLVLTELSPWTATIDNAADFGATIDLSEGRVPARVRGHVDGPEGQEPPLFAIAVHGQVAAVVDTFATDDEPHSLESMLVPSMLRRDGNELEVFAVSGPEGGRRLEPVFVIPAG